MDVLSSFTAWETSLSNMCMNHLRRSADGTALLTKRDLVPNQGKVKVLSSGKIAKVWTGTILDDHQWIKKDNNIDWHPGHERLIKLIFQYIDDGVLIPHRQ